MEIQNTGVRNRVIAAAREPLVHFLVLGVAIYGLFGLFGSPVDDAPDNTVRVTAGQIDWLEGSWQKRWKVPTR